MIASGPAVGDGRGWAERLARRAAAGGQGEHAVAAIELEFGGLGQQTDQPAPVGQDLAGAQAEGGAVVGLQDHEAGQGAEAGGNAGDRVERIRGCDARRDLVGDRCSATDVQPDARGYLARVGLVPCRCSDRQTSWARPMLCAGP